MATRGHLFARLDEIQKANSAAELGDAFEHAVGDFGGSAFAIGAVTGADLPIVREERGLERWIEYYHESGLVQNCAFSERTATSAADFTWDEVVADEPERTHEVASAAQSYGLRHGLHVPALTREGFYGCVFVQTEKGEIDTDIRQALTLLAYAAHSRLEELEGPVGTPMEKLSTREHEVLSWFAEGKSAEDVGNILGISPATVMYHYRSVADRYGTLNRTHTIVQAMRRGVLRL